ncbi:ATP-binding protein [Novosphingobium sp. EMRT-2]|uniref:ATP-binding protein n=1 Tax=Novosphingobium sp. EMRT-2 TaxID=2571749 RepID=UPI0010BDC69D|nr:ATP-binding protein [Novosphingobium sp. EMRT-2]QCI93905.1 ATP-binding protein [Novosphingobium sp. EMRT-2]
MAAEEAGFLSSLRCGRDGAIDLIDHYSDPGSTTIAECKYIGAGGFSEAKERWKEVYGHLKKHLPKLAADPSASPDSPYRTWLDPDRPIRRYRFCCTVSLTKKDVAKLEKLIAADFSELVGNGVEAVRHLAETEGAVRVLPWDWFHSELILCPSLAFRWFQGLPVGVSLFDRSGRRGQSFRGFLDGGGLAYFSRDRFAAQHGVQVKRGEADLLDGITTGELTALVLSGPGGVGKTRLAHELAGKLTEEIRGFDGYWLERGASADSVIALAKAYPAKASILLLVDYAEAAQRLAEIADAVANLIEQAGHNIRLIATGRASATNRIRDDLEVLNPDINSLTSQSAGGSAYLEWVVHSIIELEEFPDADALSSVCRGIPALAAFAVYLFRVDRPQFDAQFGALLGNQDFHSWSNKRISALVSVKSAREEDLASLALALPIPIEQQARFRKSHGALIDLLVTDRWVENIDGQLVAAHDILADALLARWVFEAETATNVRLQNLLMTAADAQDLPHALTVVARLQSHPGFAAIDGGQVLKTLSALHPEQTAASASQLLGGPILKIQGKLSLVANSPKLAETIRLEPTLHIGLAHIADEVVKARGEGVELIVPGAIGDLLDEVCTQQKSSNFILSRAYSFDHARFRDRAFENIKLFPTKEQTHFLLVRMLNSGETPEALREAVCNWLHLNGGQTCASFVYKAWLDAGGDRDEVKDKLLEWVGEHGVTPKASHVYKAWLDAEGDRDEVKDKLLEWVGEHGVTPEAQFVYKAWLDAEGDRDEVKDKLLEWVGEHGVTPKASHVYKAWLDAGGDRDEVKDKLLEWVGEHGVTPEAQFVYNAWLDAGGDRDEVKDKLLEWVGEHGVTPEASHVYRAWLEAGGSFPEIKGHCEDWLKKNWRRHDAVYLTKNLSMERDVTFGTVMRIVAWAGRNSKDEDAIYRLSRVSRWITRHHITRRSSWIISEATMAVFIVLFARIRLSHGERFACSILFGNFAKRYYPRDENWPAIIRTFCSCLRHGGVFCHVQGLPSRTWAILLDDALQRGLLDPETDRDAIIHAHELCRMAMDSDEYANLLAMGYLAAHS